MKTATPCPQPELLKNFLLGRIAEASSEAIASHLEICNQCSALAETLSDDDEITNSLRSGRNADAVDQQLLQALENSAALFGAKETVYEPTLDTRDGVLTSAHLESVSLSDYDFVTAAAGPGELGRIGNYRLLEILGRGGMGIVFRAEDLVLKRTVALKLLHPQASQSAGVRERFLREAQAAASLDHDNIVHIYQVGETHETPFIAMQFLKGETLSAYLKRHGKLSPVDVARMGSEIARGLAAAHQQGLIHRDIKPENIWIELNGRIKILDFGLARDAETNDGLTVAGTLLGTPRYMSPEQAMGGLLDHRSDHFSLGSVLYEMVTGVPAFQGSGLVAILMAISKQSPTPIDQRVSGTDAGLIRVVEELMSRHPENRPQTAQEVAERLEEILQQLRSSSLTPKSLEPQTQAGRGGSKRRLTWLMSGAAAAAFFLGIVIIIQFKDGRRLRVVVPDEVEQLEIAEGIEASPVDETPSVPEVLSSYDPAPLAALGQWKVGPEPAWQKSERLHLKSAEVLPGIIERPRVLESGRPWNIETVWPRGVVTVAQVSPDGKSLAVGSAEGCARIYSLSDFKLLAILPGFGATSGVVDLSWANDSQSLTVISDSAKTLRTWSSEGALISEIFVDQFTSVAWHPRQAWLAAGTATGLEFYSKEGVKASQDVNLTDGQGVYWQTLKWNSSGSKLAAKLLDGRVRVWNFNSESLSLEDPIDLPRYENEQVQSLAWSPTDELAMSTGTKVHVTTADGTEIDSFDYLGSATAWDRESGLLMGCNSLGQTFLRDTQKQQTIPTPLVRTLSYTQPTALASLPDGSWMIACAQFAVYSSDLNQERFFAPCQVEIIRDVVWDSTGERLVMAPSANRKGDSFRVIDYLGNPLPSIPVTADSNGLFSVAWGRTSDGSNSENIVAASGDFFWTLVDGEMVTKPLAADDVSWSPDGKYCAVGTTNGRLVIFDARLKPIAEISVGDSSVRTNWDRTSKKLAVVCGTSLWTAYSEDSWELQKVTEIPEATGYKPVWNPSGEWIDLYRSGRWTESGEPLADSLAPLPMTWAPGDLQQAVLAYGAWISLQLPSGSSLALRQVNGQFTDVKCPAWNPRHALVATGTFQGLVHLLSAEDLQPYATILFLPNQKNVTFSAAGECLQPETPEYLEFTVEYERDETGRVLIRSRETANE